MEFSINQYCDIKFVNNISIDAFGCSLDNIFITFKSKSGILYLIYSSLNFLNFWFRINFVYISF